MQIEATLTIDDKPNETTLARILNAVELARPCILISPPGSGQIQLIRTLGIKLNRVVYHIKLTDKELTDTSKLRAIIGSFNAEVDNHWRVIGERPEIEEKVFENAQHKMVHDRFDKDISSRSIRPQRLENLARTTNRKCILIIEHDFNAQSVENLTNSQHSYADAIRLNRLHNLLPILCTPLDAPLFSMPKSKDSTKVPDWLIVHQHELLISIPLGAQQLLSYAPPQLHQSLLGIIRLAEAWPAMNVLLCAKLRGMSAQQQTQQALKKLVTAQFASENSPIDGPEIPILSDDLKTTCSELLNNYQDLMNELAEQLLTHQEQMLLAHLSLFPPNIHPFLPYIKTILPNVQSLVNSLCKKNILVILKKEAGAEAEAEAGAGAIAKQTLISFSNLAWRFYAQGHLRRTCPAANLSLFTSDILRAIHHPLFSLDPSTTTHLAIEFALSSQEYDQAIELIIKEAQANEADSKYIKLSKIKQAINWFQLIPQRIINLNPKTRVIQSYYRLISDQNLASKAQFLTHSNDPTQTYRNNQSNTILKTLKPLDTAHQNAQPRITLSLDLNQQTHQLISLQQMELPNSTCNPSQASLLLDIQRYIEEQRIESIAPLAHQMLEQAFNQQKPELFLHGLIYSWYLTQINQGLQGFTAILDQCLDDSRLSTHLNEFRNWILQMSNLLSSTDQPQQEQIQLVVLPNMPYLSSLGQNLLGFMTSYINSIVGLNHCNPKITNDRIQEATYYSMNLPDTFSQTLMPIWLVETLNYLQQNLTHQAITFINNTLENCRVGSLRIHNPLLYVFESLTHQREASEVETAQPVNKPAVVRLQLLQQQLAAIALFWQQSYKKSDKILIKLLKTATKAQTENISLFPWVWFGSTSWYLLQQRLNEKETKEVKKSSIQLQLNHIESYYSKIYEFDKSYLNLSKRETEILGLVVQGCSNEEIANLLCRSLGTIKLHVHSIYKKLGVSNRVNAIKKCQSSGFLSLDC